MPCIIDNAYIISTAKIFAKCVGQSFTDGNLTSQSAINGSQTISYTWDNRNRLTEIAYTGTITQTVQYIYDSRNRRISQVVTNGGGTVNEQYIYDGNNLLAVLNGATGAVTQRFLMGPGENQVLAQENAGANSATGPTYWALTDNTGSVVDVVGNSGGGYAILDHIVYDSFGNVASQTNSAAAIRMGYQGYVQDSATGLDYANARYYDPSLDRFISQDPIGFAAGDSNLYRFVDNHPTYATDPTGLYEGGSTLLTLTSSGSYQSLVSPITQSTSNTAADTPPISLTSGGYNPTGSSVPTLTATGGTYLDAIAAAGSTGSGSYGASLASVPTITAPTSSSSYSANQPAASISALPGGANFISTNGSAAYTFNPSNIPGNYTSSSPLGYPSINTTSALQTTDSFGQVLNATNASAQPVSPPGAGAWLGSFISNEYWLAGQALYSAGASVANMITNPADAYNSAVNATASVMAQNLENGGSQIGALTTGLSYDVASGVGAAQVLQGVYGVNLPADQNLTPLQRWQYALGGVGQMGLSVATLGGSYNPIAGESTLTRSFNTYEVLSEQPISGLTRTAQRAAANNALYSQLQANPDLAAMFNQEFGSDVISHMESGTGDDLLNPPGVVWHHPLDKPNVLQLLRATEHTNPFLQPVLHPGGIGGFANFYGN